MSKRNLNVLSRKGNILSDIKTLNIYSIFKNNLLKTIKDKAFLVAVSGGPDSLALAALSKIYQNEKKSRAFFALIDHGLRKESSKEAFLVKKLLKKQKISLNLIKMKTEIKSNIQSIARKERYKLLIEFCKKKKIRNILTGHHSDDQIETFLIRLSRGSGVQGLSSMSKISKLENKITLLRPLLDLKKTELIYLSKKVFGKSFEDPSNKDQKYLRTKIRNLKSRFEKSGIKHEQIIKSINNLASTKETINLHIERVLSNCVKREKKKTIINLRELILEPNEIKLKVLGHVIKNFSNSYYPPRSKKIMNLIKKIELKKINKLTLGGCIIKKSGDYLTLTKEI